jgi:type II secretion system protein D
MTQEKHPMNPFWRTALLGGILLILSGMVLGQEKKPEQEEKVTLNFTGMELEVVAQQVERVTKKSFLFQEQLLRGKKVTLKAETPIGPDEFYRVFQTICHMHGLVLVPVKGDNINLVKIVQTQQGQKESGDQPVLARGEPLPRGDTLVYYLLTPKHIGATRAVAVLSSAISSTGVIQQVANTDLILLIDVAKAIERAEKLLSMVDLPGEAVVTRMVQLAHLTAPQAKLQLGEHLQAFEKAMTGETGRSRLIVLPDERLNTLEFMGPEGEVKHAEAYLKQIDRELPPAQRTIQYYKLKNVSAGDIADSVRQLLGLAIAARDQEEAKLRPSPSTSPLSGRPTTPLTGAPMLPPGVAAPNAERAPQDPPRTEPARPSTPKAGTGRGAVLGMGGGMNPDIEVVPLENLNTLVIVGKESVHQEVKKILENLDKRKGQVLIEVAIIQVTGDDSLDTGIEALFSPKSGNGAQVNGGTGFGQGTQTDSGSVGFPTAQTLAGFTGGAFRYLKSDDISVLLKAIATKSNVNILSQPLLLVNDNEDATFVTKVSEPTTAVSQGTATTTTSFAGFADATTSLKIVPQISPGGYLNLKITQSFEEFTGNSSATGVPPPKVSNNVTTIITVPDRYTAIMGGFTRDSVADTRTGIPFLMDFPLIGGLLGSKSVKVTKSRLYLFVRPRILSVDGFSDLKGVSAEKVRDVRTFTQGSRIEGAVKDAFGASGGPSIKEAPLPFGETEGPRK